MSGPPPAKAILLVDHGSVKAEANELLGEIVRLVEHIAPDYHVEAAHMELAPPDIADAVVQTAKRIIFCSGKVYYDLTAHREANEIKDTAIVRIEQLYPLNTDLLQRIAANYPKAKSIVWCQEEPKNMGAWSFIAPRLMESIGTLPAFAGRKGSASPAVGSLAVHRHEQKKLIEKAFSL